MGRYIIVLGVCLVASHPVTAQNPSVTELLDKYRATQDRLKRFIAKGETTTEGTIQAGGELSAMNCTGKITKRVSEIDSYEKHWFI